MVAASSLLPTWSSPAARRAVRAAIVIPGLFALTHDVVGDPQMASFAVFGGFATLVLAGFGGGRRDELAAHVALAAVGSVLLVVGTAVSSLTAVPALVTLPVAFCVLFAGIASPNAALGGSAALIAYVLPAASAGSIGTIPSRLAGWWLASVAGTLAVQIGSVRSPTDRLQRAAGRCARSIADALSAVVTAGPDAAGRDDVVAAEHDLLTAFTDVPYRPTGLAVADQAIGSLVEDLQWAATSVCDTLDLLSKGAELPEADRSILAEVAAVFGETGAFIDDGDAAGLRAAIGRLGSKRRADVGTVPEARRVDSSLHVTFHTRLLCAVAQRVASDALVAHRQADNGLLVEAVDSPDSQADTAHAPTGEQGAVATTLRTLLGDHTSLRSSWFLNSARGAVALAVAVAIADAINVQHGFWVVLGTLSILRTNATATGVTAIRALGGTVLGFAIGAGLVLAVGDHSDALWVAFPIAVLIAAYAPETMPFAVGQAAFTVMLSVLYNILAPVGWKVGEVRVEDVALGAAVSAVVGILFWPRGAIAAVSEDLADAFHSGGLLLVQATSWALGARGTRPETATAITAGARLDDALRAYFSEQGTKKIPKEQLWRLVGGGLRLRTLAESLLAAGPPADPVPETEAAVTVVDAASIAGLYDKLATRLGHLPPTVAEELADDRLAHTPLLSAVDTRVLWTRQHLDHARRGFDNLAGATDVLAAHQNQPWWR